MSQRDSNCGIGLAPTGAPNINLDSIAVRLTDVGTDEALPISSTMVSVVLAASVFISNDTVCVALESPA